MIVIVMKYNMSKEGLRICKIGDGELEIILRGGEGIE